MNRIAALLACAIALAGCTSSNAGNQTADSQDGGESLLIEAPEWAVGDWWSYQWTDGSNPTFVVTGEAGGDWIVAVDDDVIAFQHHAFDEVSTIGAVSKSNLDGSQEEARVKFFDFPMYHGKTWTMDWDGQTFDATAHILTANMAHITYAIDGEMKRQATYDPNKEWFGMISAVDAEGAELWGAYLQQFGHNYTAEYADWDVHGLYSDSFTFGDTGEFQFSVPEGANRLWHDIEAQCSPDGAEGDNGAYGVRVAPESQPAQTEYYEAINSCPQGVSMQEFWEDPEEGPWVVQAFSFGGSVNVTVVPATLQWLPIAS